MGGEFSTDVGRRTLKDLMPDAGFDYPKPIEFVARCATMATRENDIILDFFAGSGTTAHAVLELNAKDGGNRKFILVQLPEKTDNPKFPNIADITRERVRRVIGRLGAAAEEKAAQPLQSSIAMTPSDPSTGSGRTDMKAQGDVDLGFRAFRLAASNFKQWQPTPGADAQALEAQLLLHADNVNGVAASGALLYELILRAGLPVSARVERVGFDESEAFAVDGDELLICVEQTITPALMRALVARKPKKLICLDKSFNGDDALKTNAVLEAKSHDVVFQTA
jgi:adenine-specific DNA-methyltransferase